MRYFVPRSQIIRLEDNNKAGLTSAFISHQNDELIEVEVIGAIAVADFTVEPIFTEGGAKIGGGAA